MTKNLLAAYEATLINRGLVLKSNQATHANTIIPLPKQVIKNTRSKWRRHTVSDRCKKFSSLHTYRDKADHDEPSYNYILDIIAPTRKERQRYTGQSSCLLHSST